MTDRAQRKRDVTAAWQRDPANKPRMKAYQAGYHRANPHIRLHTSCRSRAARSGIGFDLTLEQVKALVAPMRCSATGIELTTDWDGPGKNPWAPSIDRIDNSVGYVAGNVRLVCWAYNLAKSEWGDDVVLKLAEGLMK